MKDYKFFQFKRVTVVENIIQYGYGVFVDEIRWIGDVLERVANDFKDLIVLEVSLRQSLVL